MNLTKKDLSAILKKELRLSVDISDSLVDEFFQAIKTTLRSHKNIKLSGFGSFETFVTKERMGRNPRSMENFKIPSQNKVRFSTTSKVFLELKMKKQVQNFNKSDLAIHLSRKFSSLNDETIIEGIDLILQEIINTVALDNRVEIRGFGSFSKKTIRPRKYINPKTKEESYLGETSIMHFKASKKLLHAHD